MKKSLIIVGIAALALSACHKVETVVTEEPQEIGFRAVSANATKANELTGNLLNVNYSIYASATQKNAAGIIENPTFFVDQRFWTDNNPITASSQYHAWGTTAAAPIYWPVGGVSIDFLAYAVPTAVYDAGTVKGVWSNSGDIASSVSFTWNTSDNQVDLLYAANNAATREKGNVNLSFNHAQALIAFEARTGAAKAITIKSITINGVKVYGTFTVDNSRNNLVASWSNFGEATERIITNSKCGLTDAYAQVGETLLVPQQPKCNFTIEYTMGGSNTMKYTYNETRGTWEMGKKYIYKLDMALSEIILTEDVKEFVDAAVDEIPLN